MATKTVREKFADTDSYEKQKAKLDNLEKKYDKAFELLQSYIVKLKDPELDSLVDNLSEERKELHYYIDPAFSDVDLMNSLLESEKENKDLKKQLAGERKSAATVREVMAVQIPNDDEWLENKILKQRRRERGNVVTGDVQTAVAKLAAASAPSYPSQGGNLELGGGGKRKKKKNTKRKKKSTKRKKKKYR